MRRARRRGARTRGSAIARARVSSSATWRTRTAAATAGDRRAGGRPGTPRDPTRARARPRPRPRRPRGPRPRPPRPGTAAARGGGAARAGRAEATDARRVPPTTRGGRTGAPASPREPRPARSTTPARIPGGARRAPPSPRDARAVRRSVPAPSRRTSAPRDESMTGDDEAREETRRSTWRPRDKGLEAESGAGRLIARGGRFGFKAHGREAFRETGGRRLETKVDPRRSR